ncbi:Ger(x)C family spore germination protein [Wukongibacter sp. M2B1]|uniref:Ger(x)C family spore germination protein n=1 Tax=Wukongibacter sp. M2B1 TaxID=3088895 RepID=UPI003D79F094
MKKLYVLVIMVFSFIFLTSCWNYREVNKMRFVAGVAIDYDESMDEYIVTSEVVRFIREGEGFGSTLFQSRGKTVFDAVRDTIMKNARKLYWGHAKVVILSRDLSDERLITALDYTSRDAEFRDDIWLLVSGEKAANEILEETFAKRDKITSFHINDILKNENSISTYHGVPAWRFIKDMAAKGVSQTLPIVTVAKRDGEKVPKLGGQAIIKGNKIVGKLNEIETKSYVWVINKLKGGVVSIETEVEGKSVEVTLEIFRNETKLRPEKIEDKIIMNIDIETDFGIGEIAGEVNVIEKKGREILKKDIEKNVKKLIEDTVKKVQKEYKADIFKFSTEIKKKMPDEWKKVEADWDEVFSNMEVRVNVTANIRGSALTSEPVKIVNQ